MGYFHNYCFFVVLVSLFFNDVSLIVSLKVSSFTHTNYRYNINTGSRILSKQLPSIRRDVNINLKGANILTDTLPAIITSINTAKKDPWYIWAILSSASTIGLLSEKTKIGSLLSSPLITMILCLILCNLGIIPNSSPVYANVMKVFVPLAIPLLLFDADMKKCIKITGRLLQAFIIGSFGTIFGTFIAYALVPMRGVVGAEKIAAALCARHIGGAVNFVAVSDVINIESGLVAAALAADNLIVAVYFAFLFVISAPSKLSIEDETNIIKSNDNNPPITIKEENNTVNNLIINDIVKEKEPSKCPFAFLISPEDEAAEVSSISPSSTSNNNNNNNNINMDLTNSNIVKRYPRMQEENEINLNSISSALTVSLIICTLSNYLSSITSISSMIWLSGITVSCATSFPKQFGKLTKAGGILGVLFMQLFFSVTGAMGHIPTVIKIAPMLLVHTTVQITCHFLFTMGVGKLFKIPFRELVLASNANVGGPTTASAMASNKRWRSLVLPALLTGVFGFAIATQVGIIMFHVLKKFVKV